MVVQTTTCTEGWAGRDHRRKLLIHYVTVQLCQTFIYDSVLRHALMLYSKRRSVLFRNVVMRRQPQNVARLSCCKRSALEIFWQCAI